MKKIVVGLLAVSLLSAVPVFAMEHGDSHQSSDVQCTKECELLLKKCALEADTIQQKIKKIRAAIKKEGADKQKLEEVKKLQQKLQDAQEQLRVIETN